MVPQTYGEDAAGNLVLADGAIIPGSERTVCEVYSRVVGYMRPVEAWNPGKQAEFHDRKPFKVVVHGQEEETQETRQDPDGARPEPNGGGISPGRAGEAPAEPVPEGVGGGA